MAVPPLDEPTRTAHWGWDEHRYFGHRVFEELTGRESLAGLVGLSILGRRLTPDEAGVLDDAAVVNTLGDPRIWPLKLTRTIASYGRIMPALSAGVLMLDGGRVGPDTGCEAAKVLHRFHAELAGSLEPERVQAVVAAYLRENRFIWGFGTPYREKDERLVAFRPCVERRGRHLLPYWKTMDAVAAVVRATRREEPNIGIAVAAITLDMGLEPEANGALSLSIMHHMFVAQAIEGTKPGHGALRELPPEYVSYRGRAPRVSPRAQRRLEREPERTREASVEAD
jgi:hypothetical protein